MFDSDLPIDRNGKWPTDSPSVSILLRARPSDTLDWKQALERAALAGQGGKKIFWQLDLGLEAPEFLWEDEFLFQAAKLALENFTKDRPSPPGLILARSGSARRADPQLPDRQRRR